MGSGRKSSPIVTFLIVFILGRKHFGVPNFIKVARKLWPVGWKQGKTGGQTSLDRFKSFKIDRYNAFKSEPILILLAVANIRANTLHQLNRSMDRPTVGKRTDLFAFLLNISHNIYKIVKLTAKNASKTMSTNRPNSSNVRH